MTTMSMVAQLYALVPINNLAGNGLAGNGLNGLSSTYCFTDGTTCFDGSKGSVNVADSFYCPVSNTETIIHRQSVLNPDAYIPVTVALK
jgi:hypothetical protein